MSWRLSTYMVIWYIHFNNFRSSATLTRDDQGFKCRANGKPTPDTSTFYNNYSGAETYRRTMVNFPL